MLGVQHLPTRFQRIPSDWARSSESATHAFPHWPAEGGPSGLVSTVLIAETSRRVLLTAIRTSFRMTFGVPGDYSPVMPGRRGCLLISRKIPARKDLAA